MPASTIASFFSFLITGFYTFWFVNNDLPIRPDIKIFLFLSIIANAFYFFYIEALTETDNEMKLKLKKCSIWEWIIRIINQFVLFSLWFLLEWNLLAFAIGLTVLYILFIVWDIITKTNKQNPKLFYTDIGGLIVTLLLLFVSYIALNENVEVRQFTSKSPDLMSPTNNAFSVQFYWGILAFLYLSMPFIGMIITKAKLFNRKLWIRENIV